MEQKDGEDKHITRALINRRKLKDRRSCIELEEYFSQPSERRENKIDRRTIEDRRGSVFDC